MKPASESNYREHIAHYEARIKELNANARDAAVRAMNERSVAIAEARLVGRSWRDIANEFNISPNRARMIAECARRLPCPCCHRFDSLRFRMKVRKCTACGYQAGFRPR